MRKTFLFILALCATMMAWGAEVTISKSIKDIAAEWAWPEGGTDGVQIPSFRLGQATVTVTGNNGYYYSSKTSWKWHCYMARDNGKFTITVPSVCKLKSVTFSFTGKNSGDAVNYNGTNYASGASIAIAGLQTASFTVGNTSATTGGQVRLSSISLTYDVENGVTEDFNVVPTFGTSDTEASGVLDWNVHRVRHSTDKMSDGTSIGCCTWGDNDATAHNSYMETQKGFEGGIKYVEVLWKQMGKEENNTMKLVAYAGDANPKTIFEQAIGTTALTGDHITGVEIGAKSNVVLKIQNESFVTATPATGAAGRFTIGSITIVPYLLFTTKSDELTILASKTEATYKNEAFINNTGATPTFSIISSEPASIATIAADGTVTATAGGTITVQAAWEGVTTTYILNITKNSLPTPEVSFADGETVEKDMNTIGYVNTLTRDGDGAVSYESSDETVAEVDAEGVITITGEGVTTITAKVVACQTYAAAEASYVLTITDPEDKAIVETFERNSGGSSTADREGAYYTWKITTGARTRETDVLFNKTPSIWLAGDNAASISTTIEGGVKRVGFLWNKFNKDASSVTISVTAGGVERTLTKEVQTGVNQNNPDLKFNSNFGVKSSNTTLTISKEKLDASTALQIGPIAITPYIFYTVKDTTIDMTKVATFTNDKLIDNRDDEEAIVYSIVGENDGVASINTQTGEVTASKAGTVTVQAAWGDVTTTYMLTIKTKGDVDAKFATEGKVEKVLANGSFTNAVVVTAGDATPAYESDNTNVAEVNASTGEVTIKAIGTATITATMAETDNYFAWEDSYTLVVRTGIEDSKKLVEHFTQMPQGLISTEGGDEVEGDIDITWLAFNTRRGANDTIGGAGVQGNNIFAIGYVDSQEPIEGGIKYFSFNWKQWATEKGATLKLVATIDGVSYEDEYEVTDPDGKTKYEHFFFGQNVFAKKNVAIKLENKSYNTQSGEPLASNGRITFDAFEIVPYLYYTEKSKSFDVSDGGIPATYTHPIINNTDDDKIEYSIDGDELGIFNTTTGEITFDESKQGTATITASWEGVTTSYTLTVTRKQDVTVSFANPTEKAIVGKDYTLQEMTVLPESTGDQSYESSDNTVAAVVEGALQIKKAGVVTITGTVAETATHKGASATYQLVIYPSEVAPNILVEDYKTATGGLASDVTNYKGNFATWKYRNSRSKTTDNLKEGTKGFMFSHTNGDNKASSYFETTLDGGIKAVYFDWRQFTKDDNGQNLIFQIKLDGTVQKSIEYTAADELVENIQSYSYAPEMKKNGVKLTFANNAKSADGKTDVTGRIMMGPLTIVPYLFYTTKEVEMIIPAGEESATYTNDELIDNRDDAVDISYSVSEGASVNNEGTVTVSAAGEYTVTATWGDVSTTYTLKVTKAAEPALTRDDLHEGQLITVCLDKNITSVEGGTFYQIEQGTTSEITFAEFAEDEFPIAKATPLLFQSDGTTMKVFCGTDRVDDGDKEKIVEYRAMKGIVNTATTLQTPIEQGNILVNNGQLRLVGANCVLTPGHAYIDVAELAQLGSLQQTPSGAPRRTIRLYNPDAAPTNLNGLNGTVKPMKVLRDGQFYIIRDTKTYNAQGIEVQ